LAAWQLGSSERQKDKTRGTEVRIHGWSEPAKRKSPGLREFTSASVRGRDGSKNNFNCRALKGAPANTFYFYVLVAAPFKARCLNQILNCRRIIPSPAKSKPYREPLSRVISYFLCQHKCIFILCPILAIVFTSALGAPFSIRLTTCGLIPAFFASA